MDTKLCDEERPCINCFSDQGECLGPYKGATWDNCQHEWKVVADSQFSNESNEEVTCLHCACPGDRDLNTGEVFWPAT